MRPVIPARIDAIFVQAVKRNHMKCRQKLSSGVAAVACLVFTLSAFAKPPLEAPKGLANDPYLYERIELASRRGIQRTEKSSRDCGYAFEYFSFANGTSFNYRVTVKRMQAVPSWKDDAEHPPLSARRAIQLASDFRRRMVIAQKDHEWKFESAKLLPVDVEANQWVWVIRFEEWPNDSRFDNGLGAGGMMGEFEVVVLMDGTVVQPETTVVHKAGYGFF